MAFPGKQISGAFATATNDSGTIVGTVDGSIPNHAGVEHGFITFGGKWAAVDFPHAPGTKAPDTMLVGITNSGVIVGDAFLNPSNEFSTPFLYKNGAFEVIAPPNMVGPRVTGISLKFGLMSGGAFLRMGCIRCADSSPSATEDVQGADYRTGDIKTITSKGKQRNRAQIERSSHQSHKSLLILAPLPAAAAFGFKQFSDRRRSRAPSGSV